LSMAAVAAVPKGKVPAHAQGRSLVCNYPAGGIRVRSASRQHVLYYLSHSATPQIERSKSLLPSTANLSPSSTMAPSRVENDAHSDDVVADPAAIKGRANFKQMDMVQEASTPPVADDFMYDFRYNHPLPTTDALGFQIPSNCDAQKEADGIVEQLSKVMGDGNAQAFTGLFLEYGKIPYYELS
jgi:hypothetical protein